VPVGSSREVILVDTDVLSYRYGKRTEFELFKPYLIGKTPAISFISYGEALGGEKSARWSETNISKYENYLRSYLLIPGDINLVREYANTKASCKFAGVGISDNDCWIAATAILHSIPLLTNDENMHRVPNLNALP
jgi:predicted nucleic acid-binding protein